MEKAQRELDAKLLVVEEAKKILQTMLRDVLEEYGALAGARTRRKRKVDPATVRHFIDRFFPPAKAPTSEPAAETIETFFEWVAEEMAEGKK
ncbi:MAG: hypothetical protein HY695_09010 [Deltaproteobacteria bacterium]|nr:hypothetical protein [Deltaproteobacteria bacterium]